MVRSDIRRFEGGSFKALCVLRRIDGILRTMERLEKPLESVKQRSDVV